MADEKAKGAELESVVVTPNNAPPKEIAKPVSFFKLFSHATLLDKVLIFIGAILSCCAGAVLPLFVLLFGNTTDTLNSPDMDVLYTEIKRLAKNITLLALGAFIAHFGSRVCWAISSERQMLAMRIAYLKGILRQDMSYFDLAGTGALTTQIVSNTQHMQSAMGERLGGLFQYFTTFVAGIVIGFVQDWKLTLVVLSMLPAMTIVGGLVSMVMTSSAKQSTQAYSGAGSVANEMIAGIRTVQSFNLHKMAIGRYTTNIDKAMAIGIRKGLFSGLAIGATYFIFFASFCLTFWYGGKLLTEGDVTGGQILTVIMAVIMASFVLGTAASSIEYVMTGKNSAADFFHVLNRKPLIDNYSDAGKKLNGYAGNIKLTNVHFRYPSRPEAKVLNGIDLEIPAGKKVALVGPSGSGKSSIIQLLQRFYDPEEGFVSLDGVDVKDLNISWWRSQFGIVGQEPALFSGTIRENICFGSEKPVTQEQVEVATRAALAHEFISNFPAGYDTQVGERGAQLSGGQKQRIAIARAILNNPKLLLLDEATSALDSQSEKKVQQALDNVSEGRTTVTIAHRLSTVRNADAIAVISKGKLVEYGTHDQLMAIEGGVYANLVRIQVGSGTSTQGEEEKSMKDDEKAKEDETTPEEDPASSSKKADTEVDTDDLIKKGSFRRLFGMNRPEAPQLLLGILGSACIGVINPIQSIIFAEILSSYYYPRDQVMDKLRPWALGYLGLAGAMLIAYTVQGYFFGYAGQKLVQRCRQLSFSSILRQEIGWFDYKSNSTGALTGKLATETTQIEGALGAPLGAVFTSLSAVITAIIIGFIYGYKYAWVLLLVFPAILFGPIIEMQSYTSNDDTKRAAMKANIIATEAISNIRTVAAYVNEPKMVGKYSFELLKPRQESLKRSFKTAFLMGVGQFCVFAANAFAFWYGGKLIRDGELTFTDFLTIYNAFVFASESISITLSMTTSISKARAAAGLVFSLIDRKPAIDAHSTTGLSHSANNSDKCDGNLEFEDVQFSYPTRPGTQVLKGLNLSIKKNCVTALVGASGCGKSSSVGLITRWYDAKAGTIKLDGVNIQDYNIQWLRSQIGLVGQEPVLFSGTIAQNIGYSVDNASQQEIEDAAKSANAHNFITQFPDGYNTQVGEKGAQLSGGQKQRIAIARAIIKKPNILLLDEATSALDTESEEIVQQALDSVMAGRTTLVIAHRLTTIKRADHIVVIDKGVVREEGTHEELLAKRGHYFRLVEAQTR